jgi:hypothetical protein
VNIDCHAREVDDLDQSFALIVRGETIVLAVRRGLLSRPDVDLLDRLLKRGLIDLLARPELVAVTA